MCELAHNRKVGNFKRGLYLGVAQVGERVPWEHEAAGSRPATQTSVGRDGIAQLHSSD